MAPKDLPDRYASTFGRLRVDKNRKKYTTGKAPHKPVLLLSLITLRQCGRADLSDIHIDPDLLELWSELWSCLSYDHAGPIYMPMFHLRTDGFWNLEYNSGHIPRQVRSVSHFNSSVRTVFMDPDLMELIEQDDSRNRLINALLAGGYFSDTEIDNLKQKISEMIRSFEYEEQLHEQIEEGFSMNRAEPDPLLQPSRDPAFRRLVLRSYASTCAVCGAKLVTSSGISVIDAAHILPFSQFHNDDVRNGLALCKIHHWLFDKGLISVDEHYRVLWYPSGTTHLTSGDLSSAGVEGDREGGASETCESLWGKGDTAAGKGREVSVSGGVGVAQGEYISQIKTTIL